LPPRPAAPNPDAAFLSGTAEKDRAEDAKGGMLKEICERGIVIFKDMTSIMSLGPVVRGRILSAPREIYDGNWVRPSGGDGGVTFEGHGRIAIVAAVTTIWDKH